MGDESYVWSRSRSATLGVVVALHGALLGLLIMASRAREPAASVAPIELLPLAVAKPARVRTERSRPDVVRADLPASVLPSLNLGSAPASAAATSGRGSTVNWTAEAHRAVKAFEIRRDAPPSDAITSPWDSWWPQGHRAGDRFKTEDGDWIVWIDANCYQIATWHSGSPPADDQPRVVCHDPQGKPRR